MVLQCLEISNHYVVHLELRLVLRVNYTSVLKKKKKKIREENNVLCFFLTKQVDTEFPLSLPPSDLNFIFYFGGG